MAFGDGIRRNVATVDPDERRLLRDALIELSRRYFEGSRDDQIPGHVSWWFKQDEIHKATHVHGGPEFLPWHREIVNRLEEMLRRINPLLSLHYWDWTQDPRSIRNANLGGGATGRLNLFTDDFMGYGGSTPAPIGEPWLKAGYYVPGARHHRDATNNPADPPRSVNRSVSGSPEPDDAAILRARDYADMRRVLEEAHGRMHGFVNMGHQHISFRDPFVFLLHSNVDRLWARWQTDPAHRERLNPATLYGSERNDARLNSNIQPWSGGVGVRPWAAPENLGDPHTYKHPSVVYPPSYDTNLGIDPPRGSCTIQQKSNHRFLDAYTSVDKDFAVVTRTAQDDDSQRWMLMPIGALCTIQQKSNDRFLDAHESLEKDFAAVTRPAQNNDTQRWVFWRTSDDVNAVTIQQVSSGRFLDAHVVSSRDFTAVTRPAQTGDGQRWTLLFHSGGSYSLQQKSSGRFLDAHEVSSRDFTAVTRPAQTDDTQRWTFNQVGFVYGIQHQHNNRFLDAHTSAEKDFAVVTRARQDHDSQRWVVLPLSSDTFTIQQLSIGRFVDAYTSSTRDFSVVTVEPVLRIDDTQRWVIRGMPPL
ncbi:hypothetical protein FCG67_01350 [Rhodococcus oryzae]|uniref:Tyrosinase copper-binding domain-containing protein n=1 Tax=Rhodococcus oryzae TaxID=2571143 RepID=A0ABY2RQH2_9NOCA|nr:RICIN domain-containing protein [Rhodococcus oryzae]TJZ81317.1 hypothetical protein FCG67_01350 [Rhodococcus oryzae]